ncbi:hypothetical protein HDU93_001306 [Gonapodya sp. JEL0774]|nr:hypothetical protein HDU93_001306 [Gonapodya sp. JEL0774]
MSRLVDSLSTLSMVDEDVSAGRKGVDAGNDGDQVRPDVFRKLNDIAVGNIVLKTSRADGTPGHARHSSVPNVATSFEVELRSNAAPDRSSNHTRHSRHSSYDPRALGDAMSAGAQQIRSTSSGSGGSSALLLPPPFFLGHSRHSSGGLASSCTTRSNASTGSSGTMYMPFEERMAESCEDGDVFGVYGPKIKLPKLRDGTADSGWSEEGVLSA